MYPLGFSHSSVQGHILNKVPCLQEGISLLIVPSSTIASITSLQFHFFHFPLDTKTPNSFSGVPGGTIPASHYHTPIRGSAAFLLASQLEYLSYLFYLIYLPNVLLKNRAIILTFYPEAQYPSFCIEITSEHLLNTF